MNQVQTNIKMTADRPGKPAGSVVPMDGNGDLIAHGYGVTTDEPVTVAAEQPAKTAVKKAGAKKAKKAE